MPLTRRDFLASSTIAGAGLLVGRRSVSQLTSAALDPYAGFAAPGEFKVKYFGRFSSAFASPVYEYSIGISFNCSAAVTP